MSKGLAFERDKRLVLEKIEEKLKLSEGGEFVISTEEFRYEDEYDFGSAYMLQSNVDLDQILLAIEKETKGRICLKSVIPVKRVGTMKSIHSDFFIPEADYTLEFFPISKREMMGNHVLTLSRNRGLSVVIDGKEKSYPLKGRRYEVFSSLSKRYKKTSDIAKDVFGSEYDKNSDQKIRVDIGEIKENIKSFFGLDGSNIIESNRGSGYRIGKQFKLIRK